MTLHSNNNDDNFIPSNKFQGAKNGYILKMISKG